MCSCILDFDPEIFWLQTGVIVFLLSRKKTLIHPDRLQTHFGGNASGCVAAQRKKRSGIPLRSLLRSFVWSHFQNLKER
jgi:hypothetical protein